MKPGASALGLALFRLDRSAVVLLDLVHSLSARGAEIFLQPLKLFIGAPSKK
jgi:hypothetical protein